ncbi:MAG: hypothetical protein U0N98_08550, partial [Collinsella sp.]
VYALPFSCQLVRPGRRSLIYAQPATFPLIGAGGCLFALVPVRCPFSARDVSVVGAKGSGYFAPKGEVAVE